MTGEQAVQRIPNALLDAMTGLLREDVFQYILSREIPRAVRYREFLALCLVGVNSASGKLSSLGRESIVTLSEALGQELRRTDSVGALSGGLGLVLLSVADESAHSVANRIRGHVAGLRIPRDPPGDREPITLSVGVASLPRHGHSGAALLAHASECLAAARRRGGNQVVSDLSAS